MQINSAAKYILEAITRKIKQINIIDSPNNKIVFLPALSIINPDINGPIIKQIATIIQKINVIYEFY